MKCISCVALLNVVILTEAMLQMRTSDQSKCVVPVSQRKSRYLPYTETYRNRKWGFIPQIQSRVNYRIDYETVWTLDSRCCDGYRMQDTRCEPICQKPCEGGYCIAPNNCTCLPGHEPSDDPQLKDHVCKPRCETNCTNGICSMPNKCMCDNGYTLTNDKLYCLPICQLDCALINAYCAAPDNCACNPGYARGLDGNSTSCLPQCDVPCQNGKCTAPNVCTCDDGYAPEGSDTSVCKPICEDDCIHGACTAPNTCTCLPGYESKNSSYCEPVCSETCEMGTCSAPETCVCEDGYGLSEPSKYLCQPICEHCENGVCKSPGVCICNEGFRFNDTEQGERVCMPFCKVPCEPYGTCDAPDTCTCFDGYRVIDSSARANEIPSNATEESTSSCEPICSETCVHGKCIGPDLCSCDPGYRPSTNDSNICEPTCEVDCGRNGACTAPNVCTCDEGYVCDVTDRCAPICNSTCESTCQNSSCAGLNRCQCLDGSVSMNETVCVAFCENDCGNGSCVAPNECRCDPGFVRNEDNSCVRPCTRVCKGHGVCIDDHRACECSYGWTGWDCDEPTVCILLVDLDDESLDGVTVQNETNSTLEDARHYAPYCYECNLVVGNKSLCYAMPSVDGASAVGCFVETESPCNLMYRSNTNAVNMMAVALTVATILIMAGASAMAYFMIRKQHKRKMQSAMVQTALFQGANTNVSLLSEEDPPYDL